MPKVGGDLDITYPDSSHSRVVSPIVLRTPLTPRSLNTLRNQLHDWSHSFDEKPKSMIEKAISVAEKAFADKALLDDEKQHLREQNNEKKARSVVKSTIVGNARIMTYEDIIDAQKKRDEKQAGRSNSKAGKRKRKSPPSPTSLKKNSHVQEAMNASRKIATVGLSDFCSVLWFDQVAICV